MDDRAEALIGQQERDRLRQTLLPGSRSEAPVLHAMAGIPGAGKSTFVRRERGRLLPEIAYLMNPDVVMTALDGYRDDLETIGAEGAFSRWELPARAFAHELLDEALARRLDVIQDMACAREENVETLRAFRARGYRVFVWHAECTVATALERIKARERHTPEDMVIERAAAIDALLPDIRDVAHVYRSVTV